MIVVLNLSKVLGDFSRFSEEEVPRVVAREHRKIAQRILQGATMGTPVDTGNARGGWDVTFEETAALTGRLDKIGGATVAAGDLKLASLKPFSIVYIQNNVHYIGELERGHSPQNKAWVAATIIAVEAMYA